MAVWEKCIVTGTNPGDRIEVEESGASWIRILSARHVRGQHSKKI
jgi:hypothetical protein